MVISVCWKILLTLLCITGITMRVTAVMVRRSLYAALLLVGLLYVLTKCHSCSDVVNLAI